MLSARLRVQHLTVDGTTPQVRRGDVVVVLRRESSDLDWEVVVETGTPLGVGPGSHHLEFECTGDDGGVRRCAGPAFLVRRVGPTLVFRGDGALEGIDPGVWRG